MKCIVTAGPTYEELDKVRRLTNFSTGTLGTELADFLVGKGHEVELLRGHYSTCQTKSRAQVVQVFTTTEDLSRRLEKLSGDSIGAVFHAAAVSDFSFGKIWHRTESGELVEIKSGKISTRHGALLAELTPTPKIIGRLRLWFPLARIVGWKYEVDGDHVAAIAQAEKQLKQNRTNACVANGPAYGAGFGLIEGTAVRRHFSGKPELFEALAVLD